MMKNQFQGLGKMKTICDYNFWIIFFHCDHQSLTLFDGIYLAPVHNYSDMQKA